MGFVARHYNAQIGEKNKEYYVSGGRSTSFGSREGKEKSTEKNGLSLSLVNVRDRRKRSEEGIEGRYARQ